MVPEPEPPKPQPPKPEPKPEPKPKKPLPKWLIPALAAVAAGGFVLWVFAATAPWWPQAGVITMVNAASRISNTSAPPDWAQLNTTSGSDCVSLPGSFYANIAGAVGITAGD